MWFLFVGALILVLDTLRGKDAALEIVIDQGIRDRLSMTWRATYGREPASEEMQGLLEDHIEGEMLFREAIALGLDHEDQIVRRRLTQKMRFLSEDALSEQQPSPDALRQWFAEREDDYITPPLISFRHIYVDPEKDTHPMQARLATISTALGASADPGPLGDLFLLPKRYTAAPLGRVAGDLGTEFVDALATLPERAWSGPIESAHGLHFVFVEERRDSQTPSFEQAFEQVALDYRAAQREQANLDYLQSLKEKYRVIDDLAR